MGGVFFCICHNSCLSLTVIRKATAHVFGPFCLCFALCVLCGSDKGWCSASNATNLDDSPSAGRRQTASPMYSGDDWNPTMGTTLGDLFGSSSTVVPEFDSKPDEDNQYYQDLEISSEVWPLPQLGASCKFLKPS